MDELMSDALDALRRSHDAVRRLLEALPDGTSPSLERALMDYGDANHTTRIAIGAHWDLERVKGEKE